MARVGFEVGTNGESVAVGHVDVEQDQVGLPIAGRGQARRAVVGRVDDDVLVASLTLTSVWISGESSMIRILSAMESLS